jgi:hypothetical protein
MSSGRPLFKQAFAVRRRENPLAKGWLHPVAIGAAVEAGGTGIGQQTFPPALDFMSRSGQ